MGGKTPTVFCKQLRRRCRKCGHKHVKKYKGRTCEVCGEDRTCNKPVVVGFLRCQAHGGPTPSRLNPKNYYGRDKMTIFPIVRLAEKYRKAQDEPRILSNRASLEVVRARIQQLLERVDVKDAPDRLERLMGLWGEFIEADRNGDQGEMVKLKVKITKEFAKAREDFMIWSQMFEAIDLDSKLVEREVKVIKEIRAFLTAEQAYDLVAKLLAVVTDVVDDPQKLKTIQYKFTRMIGDVATQKEPVEVEAEEID